MACCWQCLATRSAACFQEPSLPNASGRWARALLAEAFSVFFVARFTTLLSCLLAVWRQLFSGRFLLVLSLHFFFALYPSVLCLVRSFAFCSGALLYVRFGAVNPGLLCLVRLFARVSFAPLLRNHIGFTAAFPVLITPCSRCGPGSAWPVLRSSLGFGCPIQARNVLCSLCSRAARLHASWSLSLLCL